MTITLPNLPYAPDALAPTISAETISFHYGKHHQTYVNNLNKLVAGTEFAQATLESIIKQSANNPQQQAIFNNAAQIWNHSFYWQSMTPNGGKINDSKLSEQINQDFGSYANFKEQFATAAATQFGSGWAWLVLENGNLKIVKTANAETPISSESQVPLLVIDVWEHAYYLDHQNKRPEYISQFIENLINWDFAEQNYTAASAQAA